MSVSDSETSLLRQLVQKISGDGNRSVQLEMSTNVPAGQTEEKQREVPFDGWINGYIIGFPDGADQAVGLGLVDETTRESYFPRNEEDRYFAANDYTSEIPLRFPVEEDQVITSIFKNNDPVNSHFINSLVTITEDKPDEQIINV